MALTRTDRRRFFLATILTLMVLPALWWANDTRTSGAPNVAVVGVDVDEDAEPDDTPPSSTDEAGEPVFLDGPSGEVGAGLAEIAVPAAPAIDHVRATATFRSTVPSTDFCIVPGVLNGETITVVNLDTNRSARCVVIFTPGAIGEEIVLHTQLFSELADLTDAPIPVEIRQ